MFASYRICLLGTHIDYHCGIKAGFTIEMTSNGYQCNKP